MGIFVPPRYMVFEGEERVASVLRWSFKECQELLGNLEVECDGRAKGSRSDGGKFMNNIRFMNITFEYLI